MLASKLRLSVQVDGSEAVEYYLYHAKLRLHVLLAVGNYSSYSQMNTCGRALQDDLSSYVQS